MKHVVIVGGGFAGLNAAKKLGNQSGVRVTLIDKENYHLFQPLLYQVAMAGLASTDIASAIRSVLADFDNITVLQEQVLSIDPKAQRLETEVGAHSYDYLLLAAGMVSNYFGHDEWSRFAPSLKSIPEALEIRRRLLRAFERAESSEDEAERRKLLSFVVIGGGATGVELAGAIGEMTRSTLVRDFRNIRPEQAKITLIEGSDTVLRGYPDKLTARATADLNALGVTVMTGSTVTKIDEGGVEIKSGEEASRIEAATVFWAAGVRAVRFDTGGAIETARGGRIEVDAQLRLPAYPNIFVAGDLASVKDEEGHPLPGTATVAIQQGGYVAQAILAELRGEAGEAFKFFDKGRMATIGRSRAVVQIGKLEFGGWLAWISWLFVHLMYLVGFANRVFVLLSWTWNWLSFARGARVILPRPRCEPSESPAPRAAD